MTTSLSTNFIKYAASNFLSFVGMEQTLYAVLMKTTEKSYIRESF